MPPTRKSRRIAASTSTGRPRGRPQAEGTSRTDTNENAMPLPGSSAPVAPPRQLSAGATSTTSAPSWSGPSTTDLAAEMIRQMQAQGLMMTPSAPTQHGITLPPDATPSTVPSAQPALANVIATMTGEQEHNAAFSSIAMPVDLHIDSKLRAKIQGNGYVDFGGLSHRNQTTEQYQLQVTGDSVALVPRSRPTKITSIEQWTESFHVYVAVYCQAHPLQTAALMKYAATVQGIAKRSGMNAAMFYDDNFRTWQQHQPVVQWGVVNSELFLQSSSVMGGSGPRSNALFPGPASSTTGRCWAFNRTGFCTRGKQCRYSHRCTWCGGPHHHRACQSKGQQFAKYPPATPLTSDMPGLPPIPTKSEVPTPVRVGQLSRYLAGYNAKKARFLLLGFTHGFQLQYHGK